MQKVRFTALALASMAALAACSDNPAGPAPDAITVKPVTASVVSNTFCSDATMAGAFAFSDGLNVSGGQNIFWAPALTGSIWVGPSATSAVTYGASASTTFTTAAFAVPVGATGVSLTGQVQEDNDVLIKLNGANIFSSFDPTFTVTDPRGTYPASPVASGTNAHFQGSATFGASSGFVLNTTPSNTVSFTFFNDNALDPNGNNPYGLDFCFTVTYTPFVPPPTGGQGCTLGYWKNHTNKWTTYTSGQSFSSVFGATHNPYGTKSLLAVLQTGGGGLANLGRQTVAALLNASSGISFGESTAQVIADFQAVYPGTGTASQIAAAQNALATKFENMTDAVAPNVCPLN